MGIQPQKLHRSISQRETLNNKNADKSTLRLHGQNLNNLEQPLCW